ncbi:FAD/NAD(P)-binding domain-containing protein [Thozetella sp. PMI_491]|nr:FAD/NAD(P)-binding domain-containing protein [Thozetella sp. PMI_491]
MRVLILGAGPAGLASALALARISTPEEPISITLFEFRSDVQTNGGSVNVGPHSLRHLDRLGVWSRLKGRGIDVHAIDLVSTKTGDVVGQAKKTEPAEDGMVGMRILRYTAVATLAEVVQEEYSDTVTLRFGMRATSVAEVNDEVVLEFDNGEVVTGDVLLGCDGLHSVARQLYVQPSLEKKYTGRACLIGFFDGKGPGDSGIKLANGEDAVKETSIVQFETGTIILSYFEPTRTKVFAGSLVPHEEPTGDPRSGWKAIGTDVERVRTHFTENRWDGGKVTGISEAVNGVDEWFFWPVYYFDQGGLWARGRVLLLGEAAHAMPINGESIGIAIEDGLCLAQIFEQRGSKTAEEMFADYEAQRRPAMDTYYKDAFRFWNTVHLGKDS